MKMVLFRATMKVQDSKYYQDFSYVLKVGQSINDWEFIQRQCTQFLFYRSSWFT